MLCIVLASSMDDKVIFAVGVTKDLISKVKAGNLSKRSCSNSWRKWWWKT